MILSNVAERRASSRIAITLFAVLLAWPVVARAESSDIAQVMREPDEAQPEPTVLREVPNLELDYPDPSTVTKRDLLSATPLHLDLPARVVAPESRPVSRLGDSFRRALSEWSSSGEPLVNPRWIELDSGSPTVSAKPVCHSTPERERSWWARWNSNIWGVSASVGVLMIGTVAALSLVPQDVSGWNKPNFYGLKRTFTSGPSFDYDHYYFNYIAHPYDGSEFYLVARNRDYTWWQSFLYAAAVSSTFEFVIESAYEGASWQDLWITPVSGAVIGELRWQAKKALEDPESGKPIGTTNKILYVIVDPLDAIFKL